MLVDQGRNLLFWGFDVSRLGLLVWKFWVECEFGCYKTWFCGFDFCLFWVFRVDFR